MCTCISANQYFGRNLDLEYSYQEAVTITPRNYKFHYRNMPPCNDHYAIIGMATISNDYPLYYDATNEYGLSMAGLNFPGNAVYHPQINGKINLAPFELIPWLLGTCKNISEAISALERINVWNEPFSNQYPLTPLHWMLADGQRAITIEPMSNGLNIYDNPVGVLTNNPPFPFHLQNITNYLNLTPKEPINRFAPALALSPHSRGAGAVGLPGDLSSASRFIRAAFVKSNATYEECEEKDVPQFFRILGSVAQQKGCVITPHGLEHTIYTSCCNTKLGIYYYQTYYNPQICAVSLNRHDLSQDKLISYPIITEPQFYRLN